jgi:hypothetical protein
MQNYSNDVNTIPLAYFRHGLKISDVLKVLCPIRGLVSIIEQAMFQEILLQCFQLSKK